MILYDHTCMDKKLLDEVVAQKEKFILKSMQMVDLIVDFTLEQEKKRGESVEDI